MVFKFKEIKFRNIWSKEEFSVGRKSWWWFFEEGGKLSYVWKDLKREWEESKNLVRGGIGWINVCVFLLENILYLFRFLFLEKGGKNVDG